MDYDTVHKFERRQFLCVDLSYNGERIRIYDKAKFNRFRRSYSFVVTNCDKTSFQSSLKVDVNNNPTPATSTIF